MQWIEDGGPQTGNYLSYSNEGGSGGNGDEWRAQGQREEGRVEVVISDPAVSTP